MPHPCPRLPHAGTAVLFATAALALGLAAPVAAQTLRISHQWSTSDIRHKVIEMVAEEVAETGLEFQIYPNASLFSPNEQWTPLTRGQVDGIVYPLAYAAGRHPEVNLTLMPGLVRNHEHAQRLNESEMMERIEALLNDNGVVTLVKGWLAGGFAAREGCIVRPEDIAGKQTRAAGQSFEEMLVGAGAAISSMPSSEVYSAMQTGVLDAMNTSSASFVSFRLYEQVACFTPPGDHALWFMYQPLLISKQTLDGLSEEQQMALRAAAETAEAFYAEQAALEDDEAVRVFEEAGVEIAYMSEEDYEAWMAIARETAFANFVASTPDGKELLDLALEVE
ncbi:TRAP transporter substrate-binding protein DctP [soil metagenome]